MNLKAQIFAVAVLAALSSGCEKNTGSHEIVSVGGETYLYNKITGKTKLIVGKKLIDLKEVSLDSLTNLELASQAKNWPEVTIPSLGNVKLNIKTKYRNGTMLYIVQAFPYNGVMKKARENENRALASVISLEFYDKDGFPTGEVIELDISKGTRRVDEKGEPLELGWDGKIPMNLETYNDGISIEPAWRNFPE